MPRVSLPRVRPFANGTEFMFWDDFNCARCRKANFEGDPDDMPCPLQRRLVYASIDDGTVSWDTARRLGFIEDGKRVPPGQMPQCTEFEPCPDDPTS